MKERFEHRGVIEGFYGPPWSHRDRLWLIERMGRWGMNRYVYAPKDDPWHLARWREPYPAESLRDFSELIETGRRCGVDVGFAVSPGRSIRYASAEDRGALVRKLQGFCELGSRLITLALDDVPSSLVHEEDRHDFATLGQAHVALVAEVHGALGAEVLLCFVPTDYLGVAATDYLEELGQGIPEGVEVAWTGRTVISPTISSEEAAQRAATLRRRLLIWDNVPVSDGPMRSMLHLGPYVGRDADLAEHVSGILLNPMQHVRASAIALCTAAAYLADPRAYDPERAWQQALEEAGEGDPAALELFARAHRFSPLWPEDRDAELEAGLEALRGALRERADTGALLRDLRERVEARLAAPERIRKGVRDTDLVRELGPWLDSYHWETCRIEASLKLLETLLAPAARSARMFALFGFESRIARQPVPGQTSYGPRRVLYPQLVSMRDDLMGFGPDPALLRNRCLADEFVSLAEEQALERLGPS